MDAWAAHLQRVGRPREAQWARTDGPRVSHPRAAPAIDDIVHPRPCDEDALVKTQILNLNKYKKVQNIISKSKFQSKGACGVVV